MTETILWIGVPLVLWLVAWQMRSVRVRQATLLAASYVFYLGWGPVFLGILIASSLLNYAWGSVVRRRPTSGMLWVGVVLNLVPLAFFKYLPSMLIGAGAGPWAQEFAARIVMPVGMSFWTFQGLSYLCDLYLEEDVDPSLLEFCLYIAFWPTVMSGPVCRLPRMLPQFRAEPVLSLASVSDGAWLIVQGLLMKFFVAQVLASGWHAGEGVTVGFDTVRNWGALDVWALGTGFALQLFFDFAGYSLMAVGLGRVFGIEIAKNFDRPFLCATPADFWRSWHMSLSFWIRDYLFRPLSAMGRTHWWAYASLITSMTLFGLWHGPKWTFVIFGLYHGVLLVAHRLGQQAKRRVPVRLPTGVGFLLSWATTFGLVVLSFVLFRADTLTNAWSMLRLVFSPAAYRHIAMPRSYYALTIGLTVVYISWAKGSDVLRVWRTRYRTVLREGTDSVPATAGAALVAGAAFEFISSRTWWWLVPALSVATVLGAVAVYTQKTAIAVTPFIYTLF